MIWCSIVKCLTSKRSYPVVLFIKISVDATLCKGLTNISPSNNRIIRWLTEHFLNKLNLIFDSLKAFVFSWHNTYSVQTVTILTHGFMLNISFMLSGLATAGLLGFSVSSVQVICSSSPGLMATGVGAVGEVGLVGVGVAFFPWMSWTCRGRETRTD